MTLHESCKSSCSNLFFNIITKQPLSMETPFLTILILTLLLPVVLTAEVPSVTLMNAAKPGLKMPVAGIGTGSYVHETGTGIPGEVWNDTVAEKAVKEWLALGDRRIDGSMSYMNEVGVGTVICG